MVVYDFPLPEGVKKNDAVFDFYRDAFLAAEQAFGNGYKYMYGLFPIRLKPAYDSMGFTRGNPHDFARCVGERDKSVGLHVRLTVSENEKEIKYEFLTDPFSNLKGMVNPEKFYDTFMTFKVNYLLGPEWSHKMTKHHHLGNNTTEYLIKKEERTPVRVEKPRVPIKEAEVAGKVPVHK